MFAKPGEHGVNLVIRRDIAGEKQFGVLPEALRELFDAAAQLLVLVRKCDLGTLAGKRLSDT